MQRLVILGVLLCLLSSVRIKPPTELLTQEQMTSILVDLELAKAMAWDHSDDEDTARWLFKKNALLICQAYDVDIDTFQKSYQYYLTPLEKMKKIYEIVIQRLEAVEVQIQ